MNTSIKDKSFPSEPYRGIKPFRYVDELIFSARDWEKEQLLNLILIYRGSLLYGESGIGKSSLINAGLIPLLEENNLQANIIRIYPNPSGMFRVYKIKKSDDDKTCIPSLFDSFSSSSDEELSVGLSLEEFKEIILTQTYTRLEEEKDQDSDAIEKPIPVLIFDQFEELITLFEESGKITVTQNDIPLEDRRNAQSDLINFFRECYYDNDLRVKFLFSFREDYLAKFSKLFRAIPDLRDHSLRVKAIDKDDIKEIISCPFNHAEKDYFKYKDPFTEEIIELLDEKLKDYFGEEDAVLTVIQLVCQYLYETEPDKREALIKNTDSDNKKCINYIITQFYAQLLEKLSLEDKPLAIAILSLLVLNEHTRNIYHADAIIMEIEEEDAKEKFKKEKYTKEDITRVLQSLDNDTRLIKSEVRSGSDKPYYEINSESLIPYINTLKIKRKEELKQKKLAVKLKNEEERAKLLEKEKALAVARSGKLKKAIIGITTSFLIATLFFAYLQYRKAIKNENEAYLMAAKSTNNPSFNPSLGYWLISNRLNQGMGNTDFEGHLDEYNDQFLISDILYCPGAGELKSIHFSKDKDIVVIWQNSVNYFNKKGVLLKRKIFPKIVFADYLHDHLITCATQSSEGNKYFNYTLQNFEGRELLKFKSYKYPLIIAVSQNGKFVLVDNKIYSKVKEDLLNTVGDGIKTAVFTHDNKYIIAGNLHGDLTVYDIKGKALTKKPTNLDFSISFLNISNDSKNLIVGSDKNIVKLLHLNDFKSLKADDKIYENDPVVLLDDIGTINKIEVVEGEDKIVCTGDKVVLLNFKGEILAELPMSYNEKGAIYVEENKTFLSYNTKGNILIWHKPVGKFSTVIFSPLDLRLTELQDYTNDNFNVSDVYPNLESPSGLLAATLNYSGAISRYSSYNFNNNQKKSLRRSLSEISNLFLSSFKTSNFNTFSSLDKKRLYYCYSKFKSDSLTLTKPEANLEIKNAIVYKKLKLEGEAALVNPPDIYHSMEILQSYRNIINTYTYGSEKDYKKVVYYLNKSTEFGEKVKDKFPHDAYIKNEIANLYGKLSYYSLYTKQFDVSITSAKQGIAYGKQYDWINTNLALGLLLSGEYENAKKIYSTYRDRKITDLGFGSFKSAFNTDFDEFIGAKIIDTTDIKLNNQIRQIRKMLK